MTFSKNNAILLVILLIGIFLRLYDLGGESLWWDEGFSIKFASLKVSQIFFLQENNPPLYYIILHWWVNLFGISEFSIRFSSVIYGSLAILMIYNIGSELFDKEVGKISSLLLALSVFHIEYSQEARTYSLTVLLTLLSVYFFIKLLKKSSFRFLIGYILCSILLMYSHVYGLFIIIAQNIYFIALLLFSREDGELSFKRWALIQGILIIFFAPWVSIFISQTHKVQGDFWIKVPYLGSIISSFREFSSGSRFLMLFFGMLLLLSLLSYEKIQGDFDRKNFFKSVQSYSWKISFFQTDKIFLLSLWLLMPILLPFVISKFLQPIYATKYTIVASLAFYLLVAKGISNIKYSYFKSIVISVVVLFSFVQIYNYYTEINKEQWREVANYIETSAENDDLLLFNSGGAINRVFDYYSKRTCLTKKGFPEKNRIVDEKNIKELEPTVEDYNRVWLILSHSRDEKGLINKALNKSYNLMDHKQYRGIRVYLFKKV